MKAAVKDKPMKTGVADTPKKLAAKYTDEVVKAVRERFDQDYENWQDIQSEGKLDVQCRSTIRGPWPEEEWRSRHTKGNERPCLHEDVLSQFCNEIINEAEMNPMGVSITPQSEDSSEQTALFRENRIRQIEYEQNGSDSYLTAIKNAVQRSYGFWFLETYYEGNFKDPDNQRMAIEAAMDPDSVIPGFAKKPDWSDMRDCWVKEKMTHQEFRNRWPKAKITDFRGLRTEGMEHWFDDKTVTVAAWWHLEEDERYLLTINDGDGELDVYEDELDEGAPIDEEKISKRRTEVKRVILKTIFNGVEALDETQWIDEGDDINQPEIPVMVVTGRVEQGVVKVGDEVEIVGLRPTQKTVCTGVEMFHKLLDQGQAGDNIGVLLRGTKKEEVERGQVLCKPGSITPHGTFEANVYVLTKDEGGRHKPFFTNYRPQFYFRTTDVTGTITLPEGTEMVMPGDNLVMTVELQKPIAMDEGLRFAIREGGRTVGAGAVTKILK